MALGLHKRAVGVFPNRQDAELALRELRDSNFPMDRVSVITQDSDRNDDIAGADVRDRAGNKADEGATTGAVTGGALGGLTGLLVGLGTLAIPGIGPIMLAGATATAIATTLAGGAIGAAAGSLIGGLIGLGIPEERARHYNDRVSRGHYLVIVEGTDQDLRHAEAILSHRGIEDWDVYHTPNANTSGAAYAAPVTDRPSSGRRHRAVGVFPHRRDAEAALTELRNAGFDMDHVSIVGKNIDPDHPIAGADVSNRAGGNKADDGAKAGAAGGAALGGLGGLLVGLGALAIPGIGPVIAGGALATALATTAAGGAIGAAAGGLGGALVGLGIPEERARFYNDRVNRGDYLVMVDGNDDELGHAQAILSRHGIQDWGIFDTSDVAPGGRDRDVTHDRDRVHTGYAVPATDRLGSGRRHRAVGVFAHRRDAEAALTELRNAGFDMDHVSIVGKNIDPDHPIAGADVSNRAGGNKADDGAKAGAATGGALGGLTGLLVGLGALAIPGIGPVMAGGALATALATTAAGGAIGAAAGGLTGALVGLGIPEERARFYNDRVARGDYLVMVDGNDDEIRRAEAVLSHHGIQDWGIFDTSDVKAERTGDATPSVDPGHSGYATRNLIDDTTPEVNPTGTHHQAVSSEPEVIIVDRRNQTP